MKAIELIKDVANLKEVTFCGGTIWERGQYLETLDHEITEEEVKQIEVFYESTD